MHLFSAKLRSLLTGINTRGRADRVTTGLRMAPMDSRNNAFGLPDGLYRGPVFDILESVDDETGARDMKTADLAMLVRARSIVEVCIFQTENEHGVSEWFGLDVTTPDGGSHRLLTKTGYPRCFATIDSAVNVLDQAGYIGEVRLLLTDGEAY